jgi:hypothetical protein
MQPVVPGPAFYPKPARRNRAMNESRLPQFSAHDPGPPGWPHDPHGPAARGAASAVDPAVAKTDSFFARSAE